MKVNFDYVQVPVEDITDRDVEGIKKLFSAIFNCAIVDALAFKRPKPKELWKVKIYKDTNGRKVKKHNCSRSEMLSWEARQFFDINNYVFTTYCSILDVDPENLVKKFKDYIYKYDHGLPRL